MEMVQVKFNIDAETLNEVSDCRHNFSCLNDNPECFCEVDYDLGNGKVLFLKTERYVNCPFALSYGNSFICTCPVRKKIFKLYQR